MQLEKNYTLDESMKKTQDETFNNIKNINERALNFYDKTAVDMLGALGRIDTTILAIVSQGAMLGFAGGFASPPMTRGPNERRQDFEARKRQARQLRRDARGGQARRAGAVGLLGAGAYFAGDLVGGQAGTTIQSGLGAAAMGFAIGGPMGAVVAGGVGLLQGILSSNEEQAKVAKDRLKMERDRENQRRTQEAAAEAKRAQFLLGYLRSRSAIDFKENKEALNTIIQLLNRANVQRGGAPRTTRPEGGR
jgi:hypothetical protein